MKLVTVCAFGRRLLRAYEWEYNCLMVCGSKFTLKSIHIPNFIYTMNYLTETRVSMTSSSKEICKYNLSATNLNRIVRHMTPEDRLQLELDLPE